MKVLTCNSTTTFVIKLKGIGFDPRIDRANPEYYVSFFDYLRVKFPYKFNLWERVFEFPDKRARCIAVARMIENTAEARLAKTVVDTRTELKIVKVEDLF